MKFGGMANSRTTQGVGVVKQTLTTEAVDQWAHDFGYAVARVSVYGASHPAARAAIRLAFQTSQRILKISSCIHCIVEETELEINSIAVNWTTDDLLMRHLRRHHMHGFELVAPLVEPEFERFVHLLGGGAALRRSSGALAEALESQRIHCVRPVTGKPMNQDAATGTQALESPPPPSTATQPVPTSGAPGPAQPRPDVRARPAADKARRTAPLPAIGAVELESDLSLEEMVALLNDSTASPSPTTLGVSSECSRLSPELARELETALRALQGSIHSRPGSDVHPLRQVRERLTDASQTAQIHLAGLARRLHADRALVEQIEAEALSRGLSIELPRSRLLEQLTELIQEVLQPVTVASGVIDMMLGGHLGTVSANQGQMLTVAAESIQQVTTLAQHMKRLLGNPAGTTPDRTTLDAAYGR